MSAAEEPQRETPWALGAKAGKPMLLSRDGEIEVLEGADAAKRLDDAPRLLCHAGFLTRRLGLKPALSPRKHLDVTELYAFVCPARFVTPSPAAIAADLGLGDPDDAEGEAALLFSIANALLAKLKRTEGRDRAQAEGLVAELVRARWPWTPYVMGALGEPSGRRAPGSGFDVWAALSEIEPGDRARIEDDAVAVPLHPSAVADRLAEMLRHKGGAEDREGQRAYAAFVARAFDPGAPAVVLAEAGTGTGKTLGYLAALLAAQDRGGGQVWVSTFTKALQRQLDRELGELFADGAEHVRRVALRKGRENYLCLLNYQEHVAAGSIDPVAAVLIARWALATRDGDMAGGDFPAWLIPRVLAGRGSHGTDAAATGLTDRRGECLFAACAHYKRCYIEKARARTGTADIVIANHAALLVDAERGIAGIEAEPKPLPIIVFDEGHHLFEAADSTYTARLTVNETAQLRRWVLGIEDPRARIRARGLRDRLDDLADDAELLPLLMAAERAARTLPARMPSAEPTLGVDPAGTHLFALVMAQIHGQTDGGRGHFDLEAEPFPSIEGMTTAARAFALDLEDLAGALDALIAALVGKLNAPEADEDLDVPRVKRLVDAIALRAKGTLPGWIGLLRTLAGEGTAEARALFIDRLIVDRRPPDLGLVRHWRDPMRPFAERVLARAAGVVITSATLTDRPTAEDDAPPDPFLAARALTGADFVRAQVRAESFASPFDYATQARAIVVSDVDKNDAGAVADAYRVLIEAAGGGTLGLFTAIERLKRVYETIAAPLEREGLPLLAQHVDAIDAGTLADLFRTDTKASLLGTDALREGIDVPGPSLRLLVLDRMPWPKPSILHKHRKQAFGGTRYDDRIVRLKLRQAFGRLIRTKSDRGVFVLLDRQAPSRLLSALPLDAERMTLEAAVTCVREMLAPAP